MGHEWTKSAKVLLDAGAEAGLNRYFRAGQSHMDLKFQTYFDLQPEAPYILVRVNRERDEFHLLYRSLRGPRHDGVELEYTLPFEQAFPTLRRFLNHLWTETMTEGLPAELRGFTAPVLAVPPNPERP